MRSVPSVGSTFTRDARRAQLLRCAIDAVAQGGYGSATLEEIARRAGVSKGVVSYHFSGKDELLGCVVGDVYARADAVIRARVGAAPGPSGALDAYIDANLEFLAAHPDDVRALIAIMSRTHDGLGGPRPGSDPLVEHVEDLLRAARDAGGVDADDLTSVAVIIRAAIDAAALRLAVDPALDVDSYARELIAMVHRAPPAR